MRGPSSPYAFLRKAIGSFDGASHDGVSLYNRDATANSEHDPALTAGQAGTFSGALDLDSSASSCKVALRMRGGRGRVYPVAARPSAE